MAVVNLGAIALTATASTSGKVRMIAKLAWATSGITTTVARATLIVKSKTSIGATTVVAVGTPLFIKYVRLAVTNGSDALTSAHKYKTVKSAIIGESTLDAFTYARDIRADLRTYLPSDYDELEDVQTMLDAEASEVVRLQARLSEVLDQFYVNSATYGLDSWERRLRIDTIPERSADSRRHYINAKLRGVGTVTPKVLKNVVDAFYYAEITDKPTDYTVNIKLLGKRGVPRNLGDIDRAVTDVVPAHLQTEYDFTYATWGEMADVGLTWVEADTLRLKDLEETFYTDPGYPHQN